MILLSERDPDRILAFAEMIRSTIATPITFARPRDLPDRLDRPRPARAERAAQARRDLQDAEIAMIQAKRDGGDRIEVFRAAMRSERSDRLMLESDLRRSIERNEIKVLFQPIVRLEDRTVAGFEALLRWDHPKLGRIPPATSSRSPRSAASSSISGSSRSSARPSSSPPGSAPSTSSRRSSPRQRVLAASSCATTSSTT